MPVDHHVQRMLEELKGALARAIRSSSGVTDTIRKIRDQGFNLHLVLSFDHGADGSVEAGLLQPGRAPELRALAEPRDDRQRDAGGEPPTGRRRSGHHLELTPRETPAWVPAARGVASDAADRDRKLRQPTFRLSGYDVSLLKSLGIDPTRRGRPARRRSGNGRPRRGG